MVSPSKTPDISRFGFVWIQNEPKAQNFSRRRFFFGDGGVGCNAQAQGIPGNADFTLLLLLLCPPAKAQASHGGRGSHGAVSGGLGLADSPGSWAAARAPGSCSGAGGGGGRPGSRSGSFLAEFDYNQTVSTKHRDEPAHSNGEMSCLSVSDQLSCGGFLTFPPGCVSEGKSSSSTQPWLAMLQVGLCCLSSGVPLQALHLGSDTPWENPTSAVLNCPRSPKQTRGEEGVGASWLEQPHLVAEHCKEQTLRSQPHQAAGDPQKTP